jgi:hypothetical protein
MNYRFICSHCVYHPRTERTVSSAGERAVPILTVAPGRRIKKQAAKWEKRQQMRRTASAFEMTQETVSFPENHWNHEDPLFIITIPLSDRDIKVDKKSFMADSMGT